MLIPIQTIVNVITQFYFTPYLIMASAIYGMFRLIRYLMIGE